MNSFLSIFRYIVLVTSAFSLSTTPHRYTRKVWEIPHLLFRRHRPYAFCRICKYIYYVLYFSHCLSASNHMYVLRLPSSYCHAYQFLSYVFVPLDWKYISCSMVFNCLLITHKVLKCKFNLVILFGKKRQS